MFQYFSNIALIIIILLIGISIYKVIRRKDNQVENKFLDFINKHYKIILLVIGGGFIFTRVFLLTCIPNTIHIDEASIAYNAYSIATYGVDRYTNIFPIYFLNFQYGQSAMYTYLVALLIKIFGYSLMAVRIPAVIFGFITLIFGYLLGKELKGKSFGLLVATLITICPFFIVSERFALDCYAGLGLFSASIYTLVKAIKTSKAKLYICSGLLFGLTLYAYALAYIIIPVVLLLILIYLIYLKKITLKNFICFCIPLFILATPLVVHVLVQQGVIGEIRTRYFSILQMSSDRVSEIALSNILDNIPHLLNFFLYDPINSSKSIFGTLYYFSIPLVLVGMIITFYNGFKNIKNKEFNLFTLFSLVFLGTLFSILLNNNSTTVIWRGNMMYVLFAIFIALGIYFIVSKIKVASLIIFTIYLLAFGYYNYYYFNVYPNELYNNSDPMTDYMEALEDADKKDKDIYAISFEITQWTHLWAALALKTSPYAYQEYGTHFDNIYFTIPDKFDDDDIYIVLKEQASDLKKEDFTCRKFGKVYECYK